MRLHLVAQQRGVRRASARRQLVRSSPTAGRRQPFRSRFAVHGLVAR